MNHAGQRQRRSGPSPWHRLTQLVAAVVLSVAATGQAVETEDVFQHFARSVVRLQVVESGSGAKAVVGSGFFVTDEGHIVTNYHVISKVVRDPGRYHVEVLRADQPPLLPHVLAIDVVHDLAVLRGEERRPRLLTDSDSLEKGTRLYALGHPHDLGLSIVEGTYNGRLEHALYEKIHFTGSLNPGMSGGPTITRDGQVVGVNVSTAGNQVSFLVPVERVRRLLSAVLRPDYVAPNDFFAVIDRQILAHQEQYFATLLAKPLATEIFGPFRLPGKIASFFNCWGDAQRKKEELYEVVHHRCSTDDQVYISEEQSSGVIRYQHVVLTNRSLNRFQFSSLYSSHFRSHYGPFFGSKEEVTRFDCENDSVIVGATVLRVAFCARAYRKLPGLYDVLIKTAVLGSSDAGAVSSLAVAGISFANARRLLRRYVEAVRWKR